MKQIQQNSHRMRYLFLLFLACGCFTIAGILLNHSNVMPQAQAQTLVSGALQIPRDTYFDNQIIVRYRDGFTPSDIEERVELREQRAQTVGGAIQNAQENISLFISGETPPEQLQENLNTVIQDYQAVPQNESTESQTYLYTLNTDTDIPVVQAAFESLPVEYVQPNYKYYLQDIVNDPDYIKQWGLQNTYISGAWNRFQGSKSLRVAIIDSGIDRGHPDLTGSVEKSKPIMSGCFNDGDSNGHGSHVAGIIGAVTQNNQGIAGINWDITLLGYCVVSPDGTGSSQAVAQGIRNATDDGAKVINLSLGGPAFPNQDFELKNALSYAASKDVVLVAAAGNCGRYAPGEYTDPQMALCYWGSDADKYLPASDPLTISVAATGPQNEHPVYSNAGSTVDIAAPGGNPPSGSSSCNSSGNNCIYSTWNRFTACPSSGAPQGYCSTAGTSMAAPFVTGLAALIRAANPSLNRAAVQSILENSADDLGQPGKDTTFGYGRINGSKALEQVLGSQGGPTPILLMTPSPLPSSSACTDKRNRGDYNCDGTVALSDFETWRQEYERGISQLLGFEIFRQNFADK